MILFAWGSNTSVLGCFLATVPSGILLVFLLSAVNCYIYRKSVGKGNITDAIIEDAQAQEALKAERKAAREARKANKKGKEGESAIPALLMPIIILGSIYLGFLTATEAAALSVLYGIPVVIMAMVLTVQIFSRLYITENLPDMILVLLTSISSNKYIILFMINIFMVFMGMLMDDTSNTILLTPILMPVMASLGISPFHFAAILGVNIGIGNVTPATAPLPYLSARITGSRVEKMLKPTVMLILFAWIPTLIITTYWPAFAEFLPRLMGYM